MPVQHPLGLPPFSRHLALFGLMVRVYVLLSGVPPIQQAQAVGLDALLDFLSDCALMTAGVEVGADSPVDAVRLATLHGSKGLEFNTVLIVGADQPLMGLGLPVVHAAAPIVAHATGAGWV